MSGPSISETTSTLGERPHDDRIVCVRSYGERSMVEKTYVDADASEIFSSMMALWGTPFGSRRVPLAMPEPLAVNGSAITMSFVGGEPLGRRGSVGKTLQQLPAVASVLADFHNSGVTVPRLRHPDRLLRSLDRKAERIAEPLKDPFRFVVAQHLRPLAPKGESVVVSHGDFSPRNLLVGESDLVLIDFDRLQMAGRGRDLGYFGAWVWVTEFMSEPMAKASWDTADELVRLYSLSSGVSESSLLSTAPFYRAAALLRIAQSWSALDARPDLSRVVIESAARICRAAR
jgi:aminoglycoside phosphotransferase (APT) family kinase protein